METTYGGRRAASKMIASGVFDRHPDFKVIVSEGGRLGTGRRGELTAGTLLSPVPMFSTVWGTITAKSRPATATAMPMVAAAVGRSPVANP